MLWGCRNYCCRWNGKYESDSTLCTHEKWCKFGPATLIDGMQKDGFVDAYDDNAMGVCADLCATEHNFSREEQDAFALTSYERSADAWGDGKFA